VAKNCATIMLSLVHDILDIARCESRTLELNYASIQTESFLKEALSILQFQAEQKQIPLRLEMREGAPKSISIDPDRLRQIIINLLSNAIKFTHSGFVALRLKTKGVGKRARAHLSVVDTGIGIDEAGLRQLFKAFGKLKDSQALNRQGCGLGLAISKTLATAMGGELRVKSAKDAGSKFTLVLPLRRDEGPSEVPSKGSLASDCALVNSGSAVDLQLPADVPYRELRTLTESVPTDRCLKCAHILVADDQPFNILILRQMLEDKGY